MSDGLIVLASFSLIFLPAIIITVVLNVISRTRIKKRQERNSAETKADSPTLYREPSEYELQMRRDFHRYTHLREELKKISMEDVNQWHEVGRITDVQYNEIRSTYNSMKDEMEEIRKRVRTINRTSAFREPEPQKCKGKERKRESRAAVVIACISSILLVVCAVTSGVYIYNLTADYNKLNELYSWESTLCDDYEKKYVSARLQHVELKETYEDLEELYDSVLEDKFYYMNKYLTLKGTIDSKLKIGDSEQIAIDKCGSPDKMVERIRGMSLEDGWTLYYGTSYVLIDEFGKVEGWYAGDTELPVE